MIYTSMIFIKNNRNVLMSIVIALVVVTVLAYVLFPQIRFAVTNLVAKMLLAETLPDSNLNMDLNMDRTSCSTAGETKNITAVDGDTGFTNTYRCTETYNDSYEPAPLIWLLVKQEFFLRGTMCGLKQTIFRSIKDITYIHLPPTAGSQEKTTNTLTINKLEVPAFRNFCYVPGIIEVNLACNVLTNTSYQKTEDGHVWSQSGYLVPPGDKAFWEASKYVKDTLDESKLCPTPYRRLGPKSCELTGDHQHFQLRCP